MSSYPYSRIKDDIKRRIMEGEWLKNAKLPSSRDFAVHYQASVNTVEKAIKELCADGLLKRDSRRGTFVDSGVKAKAEHGGSGLVAASVIGIENPLWATALRGIEDVLHVHGFHLLSYSDDRSLEKLESLIKGAVAKRVDGVILSPFVDRENLERNKRLFEWLQSNGTPLVFLDRHLYDSDIPFVTSDNVAGAYSLTKLLIDHGHRNVVFIRNSDLSTLNERFLGFKQAYLDRGLEFSPEQDILIPTRFENFEEEFEAYASRVAEVIRLRGCTAVFAANDQIAEAVIAALNKLGMAMPGDVSLVSYDAVNLNRKFKLDVTGVNQPFYDMGRTAAVQLMNLIEGKGHQSVLGQICKAEIHKGGTVAQIGVPRQADREETR
ncbi:GntR family transcriptional regulator [Cohnella sp. CIP 111063]|uniref:GntR family transcriptional regulator n=1 Tax=unclassified Cohnella TaxID=2636738 RepID=UPI000B8C0ACE|nr:MULTISPECIES: GntR family transcriptional regulator [unclassified Cohnella]OXS61889.1 GntR family transcriptional regulator [Cohnella sp. CIP 111063]PRX74344.1 DNA-binding LacI/PurR family transcriptional regulator [Cohnella sp. SGD-V74]